MVKRRRKYVQNKLADGLARAALSMRENTIGGLFSTVPEQFSGESAWVIRELRGSATEVEHSFLMSYVDMMEGIHRVSFTAPGNRVGSGAISAKDSVGILKDALSVETMSELTLRSLGTAIELSELTRRIYKAARSARGSLAIYLWGQYKRVNSEFLKFMRNNIFVNIPNMRYSSRVPDDALVGAASVIASEREAIPDFKGIIGVSNLVARDYISALENSAVLGRVPCNIYLTGSEVANLFSTELPSNGRGFLRWLLEHLHLVATWDFRLRIILTEKRDHHLSIASDVMVVHLHRLIRELKPYLPLLSV